MSSMFLSKREVFIYRAMAVVIAIGAILGCMYLGYLANLCVTYVINWSTV